jgi:hypothetical protein
MCVTSHLCGPVCGPVYGIITLETFGVTNQSAAFDPHPDVGFAYIKTKRLQLGETL